MKTREETSLMEETATLTPDVAVFLRDLLAAQTVQVGAPDFEAVTALAAKAFGQLTALTGG